jgi:hypothetical protein
MCDYCGECLYVLFIPATDNSLSALIHGKPALGTITTEARPENAPGDSSSLTICFF